jgi:hypothetical protein
MRRPTIHTLSVIALALVAGLAIACGKGTPEAQVAGGATSPAPQPLAPGDTSCPLHGNWQTCSIAERLERAGLAPQLQPDTLRDAAFGVPGVRWMLDDATLDVFVYATGAARERATRALDSAAVVRSRSRLAPATKDAPPPPRGISASPRQSHFVRTANIAVILANARQQQAERILLAITAGQPAR